MLVSRLLRSLLRFLSPGIVPDDGGGASAPVIDTPAPAPAAEPVAAAPASAAEPATPADPMAGLKSLIDNIGTPEPAGGRPRDPLGRFAPADPNAPPVAQAPAAPAQPDPTKAAAPTPAPKPGEIDLTPPEGMTERAQQRWTQLTERAKQLPVLEQRATQAESQLGAVRQMVQESGLAPQEFTQFLELGRNFKSAAPQDLQQALARLDTMRADIATRLGVDVPGVDPLAQHADLKADVDGMLMTRERALEIARHRTQSAQTQAATNEQRDMANFRQTVQTAAATMDQTLRARAGTPGHEAKVAYVTRHFSDPKNLQAFVSTYQPQQWSAALTMMYDAFTPPAAAPAVPAGPQPLRPNSVRAGAAVQNGPVTMQGAIQNAFAAAGL